MSTGNEPALILDKSAFEMLNKEQHFECARRYRLNVLPVLVREIHGDIVSRDSKLTLTPEERVRALARRFFGSGDPPNVQYQEICRGSLLGQEVVMDGRPIWDGGQYIDDDGTGESAMFFDGNPLNREILRMADGRFTPLDRADAADQRLRNATFSVTRLEGSLRGRVRRPRNVDDIPVVVDELLSDASVQAEVLWWLVEQLRLPQQEVAEIGVRWARAQRPPLSEFAPYAQFCARAILMLMVGMRHKVLSDRPTNRVDLEYLLYAPFCEVFVSEDKLHRQLAPLVLRLDQTFRVGKDFKLEPQAAVGGAAS